jgi:hypothetical protein
VCLRWMQDDMVCPFVIRYGWFLTIIVGKTTSTSNTPDSDLSIDVLTSDLLALLQILYPAPAAAPTFIVCLCAQPYSPIPSDLQYSTQLVGHSMGGSVVVRTCPLLLERKYRVGGVAVLDVVEGIFILICVQFLCSDLTTMDRIGD